MRGVHFPAMPQGDSGLTAAVATRGGAKHRRRPPSPTEQARRLAWGKRWGAVLSEHAKTYKRKV